MPGWTRQHRLDVESAFYDYLGECYVNSKDYGRICLGENLYDSQKIFYTSVFDGLEQDIHTFDALKSRQLGISTSTRALSIFWGGIHDGLSGCCLFDTDLNKNNARRELVDMINGLPKSLKFPKVDANNRTGIVLDNGSNILFMSAGVRPSKGSSGLGRSVGLWLCHMSELCNYDNPEGMVSLEQSLSEINPNRLYIRESTGKGFNDWYDMWKQDRQDPAHVSCIFLGWWSKNSQIIKKTDPDFERYGLQPPTDREIKRIKQVKELYGWDITPEQLAWVRRKMDPTAKPEGDQAAEYEGNTTRLQEQAWVEEDSFQFTGTTFFAPEALTEQVNKYVSSKFQSYMFGSAHEFVDLKIYKPPMARMIELKIWEEPVDDAIYVVAADPAYGSDEKNDRSAIQVLRCYADGCDQVAEYAWPLIVTRQFAWTILALAGWYAGQNSEVYLIVELNGPGTAVWDEIQHVKTHLQNGYQRQQVDEKGLRNMLGNVRNYIYNRPDSMAPGKSWQWKTTMGAGPSSKVRIMERLRDFVDNGMLRIRSLVTLEEMKTVKREGDSIAAKGRNKDDRVVSLALGVRCWEERVRRAMSAQKRTRENEIARRRMTIQDKVEMFNRSMFENFMAAKTVQRRVNTRLLQRARWRSG